MRYLSLFSGIEAATAAWHPLGWTCVAVAEIEPFPCAVLAHHYPDTPNLGNVTQVDELDIAMLGPIDLIVFGSPCQDLSVAGKRKGLAGERSGLFHTAINIVEWARKHCGLRWALWENVPGAFSSNQGRDFASVVESLAGLDGQPVPPKGWGTEGCAVGSEAMVEWAVLDAQWFGVAQRRRRVFALADFGDWGSRPPVLLEPQGLRGDSAPRRETGQRTAEGTARRTGSGKPTIPCLMANAGTKLWLGDQEALKGDYHILEPQVAHSLRGEGFDASEDGTGRGTPLVPICIKGAAIGRKPEAGPQYGETLEDVAYTQNCVDVHGVMTSTMQVRRLTPRECERLQGFPDDYTLIPYRNKPAADGPRYKALGNSMAVPVMRWIGSQVQTAHGWGELA